MPRGLCYAAGDEYGVVQGSSPIADETLRAVKLSTKNKREHGAAQGIHRKLDVLCHALIC